MDVGRDNHSNETIETQKKLMMKQIGEATHLVATLGLYPWQIVQRSRLYVIVSTASFIFTRIDLLINRPIFKAAHLGILSPTQFDFPNADRGSLLIYMLQL